MALADEFEGMRVDLDGVVWIGRELVPGSIQALRQLIDAGKEIVFVTNNPGKPAGEYAQRLAEAGVEVGAGQIVTAGEATAAVGAAGTEPGSTSFVIGAPAFHDTVAAAGLDVLEG